MAHHIIHNDSLKGNDFSRHKPVWHQKLNFTETKNDPLILYKEKYHSREKMLSSGRLILRNRKLFGVRNLAQNNHKSKREIENLLEKADLTQKDLLNEGETTKLNINIFFLLFLMWKHCLNNFEVLMNLTLYSTCRIRCI